MLALSLLAADVILHKGMSRVLFPASFTDQRSPRNFARCEQPLKIGGKKWVKGVNTVQQTEQLAADAAGFELDVYFDTLKNHLEVYHDSSLNSGLDISTILNVYAGRKLSASVWLDFKNLSAANEKKSLHFIAALRRQYGLQNKLIVESSAPKLLQSFCDSGFFTCYYVPFFNPYLLAQKEILQMIDTISFNLKKYPASALSGYYFQYPLLKKFFPNYPLLTWADNAPFSLVGKIFNGMLLKDERVKVVLYPF